MAQPPGISTALSDPNSHISDPSLVDADKDTDKDADKQAATGTPRVHGSPTVGGPHPVGLLGIRSEIAGYREGQSPLSRNSRGAPLRGSVKPNKVQRSSIGVEKSSPSAGRSFG